MFCNGTRGKGFPSWQLPADLLQGALAELRGNPLSPPGQPGAQPILQAGKLRQKAIRDGSAHEAPMSDTNCSRADASSSVLPLGTGQRLHQGLLGRVFSSRRTWSLTLRVSSVTPGGKVTLMFGSTLEKSKVPSVGTWHSFCTSRDTTRNQEK